MVRTHDDAMTKARIIAPSAAGRCGRSDMNRDFWEINGRLRRRCYCGCGRRATYTGGSNGVAMMHGCELSVRRWVRDGK